MKRVLSIFLGILTAIGGFVDIGDLVANALVGSQASARSLPDTRSFDRLTQALENSRQIREESERTLDRAKETARSWRRHYGAGGSASERPDRPESIDH